MIFVTVGSWESGFDRLLGALAGAAERGCFGREEIIVQARAIPDGLPESWQIVSFLRADEFDRRLREASLVISHGGSTLVAVARSGKLPVAMPRRPELGEIINDHQLQFVVALAHRGLVVPAYEEQDIPAAVAMARTSRPGVIPSRVGTATVADAVRGLAMSRKSRE